MKRQTKVISGIIGFALTLIPGCSGIADNISKLPPQQLEQPVIEILPKEPSLQELYEEIKHRGGAIKKSLEKNFPEGLVVYLKGYNARNGGNIFVYLSESNLDSLKFSVYRCSNSEVQERLKEFYLFDKTPKNIFYDADAISFLDQTYDYMAEFYDSGKLGIGNSKGDSVTIRRKGREDIFLKEDTLTASISKDSNLLEQQIMKALTSK